MNFNERIDIIVLGATGFTGKYVVRKLALLNKEPEYKNLKWGISGRSMQKLQNLTTEVEKLGVNISTLPVLECDIRDEYTVTGVARRTKVLMNATGPNTLLSEPVVKACIATGTHYVDISAELFHMLNIYRKYNKVAEDSNVLIVPACGFASIPVTIGLIQLEKQFQGTLQSVECYTELKIPKRAYIPGPNKCLVHFGTWDSLIYEMKNFRKYRDLKKQTFAEPKAIPEELLKCFFHKNKGKVWFPYPGPDSDIVEMTQLYLREKKGCETYHFRSYTTMPLLLHFFIVVPVFFLAYLLCHFDWFNHLLQKYPRFFSLGYFSHEGPSEQMMNDMKYSFTLNGRGWHDDTDLNKPPNKTLTVKVFGSDPGYKTTAIAFIFSAITIIKEIKNMPKGGVLTTGAAFRDTQIVDHLIKHGMSFETIRDAKYMR